MVRWGVCIGVLAGGFILLAAALGLAQTGDALAGKKLFHSKDPSTTATGLACIHCHADFNEKKNPDRYVRPGHPLFNSAYRSQWQTWEEEKLSSLEQAIETCMRRWMTARTPEGGGEPPEKHKIRKLIAYLETDELSPEKKSKPIEPMWTNKIPGDRMLRAGDSALGAFTFERFCAPCHVMDGSGPAPSLLRNGYSMYQIAKKIRQIDNRGIDGLVMPPFPKDRLSDRELINIVAFVYQM